MTPDVACLAEGLRTCLQESDEVPTDYTQLFHTQVCMDRRPFTPIESTIGPLNFDMVRAGFDPSKCDNLNFKTVGW